MQFGCLKKHLLLGDRLLVHSVFLGIMLMRYTRKCSAPGGTGKGLQRNKLRLSLLFMVDKNPLSAPEGYGDGFLMAGDVLSERGLIRKALRMRFYRKLSTIGTTPMVDKNPLSAPEGYGDGFLMAGDVLSERGLIRKALRMRFYRKLSTIASIR